MSIQRRDFVKYCGLGVAAAFADATVLFPARAAGFSETMIVRMAVPDGMYAFHIDGEIQMIAIRNSLGTLYVPGYAYSIDYVAQDGVSPIHVNIDARTQESVLFPGFPIRKSFLADVLHNRLSLSASKKA